VRILMAFLAHSDTITQAIVAAGSNRVGMMRLPVRAKRFIAPATVSAMTHFAFALSTRAPISGGAHLCTKGHFGLLSESELSLTTEPILPRSL